MKSKDLILTVIIGITLMSIFIAVVSKQDKELRSLNTKIEEKNQLIGHQETLINNLNIELEEQRAVGNVLYDISKFYGFIQEVE